jgi:hypothetical protein
MQVMPVQVFESYSCFNFESTIFDKKILIYRDKYKIYTLGSLLNANYIHS